MIDLNKYINESLFDVDDNIDNVDIDTLYGCWNTSEEKEFAQRSNRLAEFIKSTCKSCYKVPSEDDRFLSDMELENNKWYVGLNYCLDDDTGYHPEFYHKSGNKLTIIEVYYKGYSDKGGKISKKVKPVTGKLIYLDKKDDLFLVSKQIQPILDKIIKLAK